MRGVDANEMASSGSKQECTYLSADLPTQREQSDEHRNHDNDGGPGMWHFLTSPEHNPVTAARSLHAAVTVVEGVRIAGLGGTFRPRIWEPPAPPRLHGRAALPEDVRQMGRGWRPEHIDALVHSLGTTAIWPEDYDYLAGQRADILVTHEAPSSHPAGSAALDALARAMGARLIVHGHHHVNYLATAEDGLQALGVAAAWGATATGDVLWEGEAPRHLTASPDGMAAVGKAGQMAIG